MTIGKSIEQHLSQKSTNYVEDPLLNVSSAGELLTPAEGLSSTNIYQTMIVRGSKSKDNHIENSGDFRTTQERSNIQY